MPSKPTRTRPTGTCCFPTRPRPTACQANDVKCSHGSTSGRIPAEQKFYLQSRGIDPAKAHELIVFGFFEEVLNKLANEHLHAVLSELIQSKFKKS